MDLPFYYQDAAFWLQNLILDGWLLWTVGRLMRLPLRSGRLLATSAMGALYASLSLTVWSVLAGPGMKVLLGIGLLLLAFGPQAWRRLLAGLGILLAAAFVLGGTALGLLSLVAGRLAPGGPLPLLLSEGASLVVCTLAVLALERLLGRHTLRERMTEVRIRMGGGTCQVRALVDSGHSLSDPLTRRPVVVVEGKALRSLLPDAVLQAMADPASLSLEAGSGWERRLRVVPFHALGQGGGGLLLAFEPDALQVVEGDQEVPVDALVGLSPWSLRGTRGAQALLPQTLLLAS